MGEVDCDQERTQSLEDIVVDATRGVARISASPPLRAVVESSL